MRGIFFAVLFVSVFTPMVFADDAEVCQGCQDACYAMGGSCPKMDYYGGDEHKLAVIQGQCAFQCKVVKARDGSCPSASEVWRGICEEDGSEGSGTPSQNSEAEKSCKAEGCPDYCEGTVSYYDGECDPYSDDCLYLTEECEFMCDEASGRCIQNTQAPEIEIELTPQSIVASSKQEIDIMVQLSREGKIVEGADVYIRVSDPEFTGLLGEWGFLDVKKSTDAGGIASATLGLPGMKSIDRMHYGEFPLELEIEVTAAKHSGGEDWSAKKTGSILVESPVPKITGMSISPDPAQAYGIHVLGIEVEDADEGAKNLKYTIRCFGGELGTHSGEASNSDQYSRVFYSGETSETIEWTAPSQGIDENEPVEFRENMANLEGLSKNLGANRFGVVGGVYKAANGLNGNAMNLAQGFHSLTQSESWKESAYRTLDLGLEGFKTFVGVYTLGFKSAPGMLGKLSNDAGDFVDAGIGGMQAKLKGLAHQARANEADTRITEYGCAAIVEDSDGYADWHFYQFELEYEGFESDKQYGKEDQISG